MSTIWTTEGKVKDLKTGQIYELGGTTFIKKIEAPDGNGLVLKECEDSKSATIEEVTTIKEGDLRATKYKIIAWLDNYEVDRQSSYKTCY